MPAIVTVNVSLLQAPTPNTLQQTGGLVSQGGTTKPVNSLTLLTQLADLTAILATPVALTSLTWSSGVVTATTSAPHGLTTSDTLYLTIAGASPAGYNGTYLCTVTGASTFTYPVTNNPGVMTLAGTYVPQSVAELLAMGTTYFAQGSMQSVYVLELGKGGPADGITALTTWLTNNPLTVYSFLIPRAWDSVPAFLSLISNNSNPTSRVYFWTTTTAANYTNYTATMKAAVTMVEAPGIPATEFSLAAAFYWSLAYRPGSLNRVSPFCFQYLYGVTPYPTVGNGALLAQFKAGYTNFVGTGAEGGISNTMLQWGTTEDGRDFTYWYSVDYTQINAALVLANEVINGSNNYVNPLYFDQHGINRLQARLSQLMANEITYGLAVGTVLQTEMDSNAFTQALDQNQFSAQAVVNAIPFVPYCTANPSDYKIGKYAGLTIIYIPARGFTQIILNLVVSDFITF